jgi:hypothetical protein
MRLTSFDKNGTATLGFRVGDDVVDLKAADPGLPGDLRGMLEAGPDAFDRAATVAAKAGPEHRTPFAELKFHPLIETGQDRLPRPQLRRPCRRGRPREADLSVDLHARPDQPGRP